MREPPDTPRLVRARNFFRGAFVAMANPCEVLIETEDETLARAVLDTAAAEALRIERKFSRYRSDSAVYAINVASGRSCSVDAETAQLIDYSATLWRLSDGAFDITSGVLRHAWHFNEGQRPPSQETVAKLQARVGWDKVTWANPVLTLAAGMELDFGGVGKEYAVDRAVQLIEQLTEAAVLVNFGGDLRTTRRPPSSGTWQVGIESIRSKGRADALVKLASGAIATSGDSRRCIEIDGVRFGHILDARTGWPTPGAPRSVTVAADTCTQAGTYSTLAILHGADAEEFLTTENVRYWCLR